MSDRTYKMRPGGRPRTKKQVLSTLTKLSETYSETYFSCGQVSRLLTPYLPLNESKELLDELADEDRIMRIFVAKRVTRSKEFKKNPRYRAKV